MKNIINISNYRYGRVYQRLRKAAKWLNNHQLGIAKRLSRDEVFVFGYPDYWNMPRSISYKLSGDEVDFIQMETRNFVEDNYRSND